MAKFNKTELEDAISKSYSIAETLIRLGYRPNTGGNHNTIKKYCKEWNIDTSHFLTNAERCKIMKLKYKGKKIAKPLEEILKEGTVYKNMSLKDRLYNNGLKKRECELCGQNEIWKGKKMSLILDHINGIRDDLRIENLRIVCANCNATLPTHTAKNKKSFIENPKKLPIISHEDMKTLLDTLPDSKPSKTKTPKPPAPKGFGSRPSKQKIQWPSKEELEKLVWEKPRSTLAIDLGVSDNAIIKRCKQLGIKMPERGYWAKLYPDKNIPSKYIK